MGQATEKAFNEDFAVFFEGELVGEADLVYRLAYTLTLNQNTAFSCVKQVYQGLAKDLPNLVNLEFFAIRQRLFKDCLAAVSQCGSSNATDSGDLANFLKNLDLKDRSILVMNELAGLKAGECATILELDEGEVRKRLAKVRKELVALDS